MSEMELDSLHASRFLKSISNEFLVLSITIIYFCFEVKPKETRKNINFLAK